jgi:hypothetical protein
MSMFVSNLEVRKEILKRKTLQRVEQFSNKNWGHWQFDIHMMPMMKERVSVLDVDNLSHFQTLPREPAPKLLMVQKPVKSVLKFCRHRSNLGGFCGKCLANHRSCAKS